MLPLEKLKEKAFESCAIYSQARFLERKTNAVDQNAPIVIYGVTDETAVLEKLRSVYGGEISTDGDTVTATPLPLTERRIHNFGDLVEIIKRLRDDDGCQWDRAQTNMTIRENAIEEAYELVEAVELDDAEKMREESGDVILQGLFHAIIAESDDRFSVGDVIDALCVKLITRHTHIFGANKANNAEEALYFWEKAKAVEKGQATVMDKINSVPKTLGSAMRANKVQKIAKKVGFDFATIEEAAEKVKEELTELLTATAEDRELEGGDLLFAAINVLRMMKIDPELALTSATNKFIKRFSYIEARATEQGKSLYDCTFDEMETWYQEGKKNENR